MIFVCLSKRSAKHALIVDKPFFGGHIFPPCYLYRRAAILGEIDKNVLAIARRLEIQRVAGDGLTYFGFGKDTRF